MVSHRSKEGVKVGGRGQSKIHNRSSKLCGRHRLLEPLLSFRGAKEGGAESSVEEIAHQKKGESGDSKLKGS